MADETLRDSISAAFEKTETPVETVEETQTPAVEVPSDDTSIPVVADAAATDIPGTVDVEKDKAVTKEVPVAEAPAGAPVSLNAQEKAEWAKAPKAIQQAYLRREEHTQKVLRESSESRKLAEEFNQTVGPYMPLIRASNSTPMVAFKNLMTTAAGLTLGTPQQKAQIIRDVIQNYQIDLKVLDEVLSNNLPTAGKAAPGTSEIEVHVQKAIAPVYEFMENINKQRSSHEQRMQQQALSAVEKFQAQNEFFDELRDDIADLMEVSANRGREMTIQQAYNIAVEQNPTIKAAIAQKKAAQGNGAAERAQRASLSVSGSPRGSPVKDTSQNSLRDDLLASFQNLGQ